MMRRAVALAAAASVAGSVVLSACSGPKPGRPTLHVLYAGSLVRVMQSSVIPRFQRTCACAVDGEALGSLAIANLIKGGIRRPDLFISADPAADRALQGRANGNHVAWWVDLASTELVIGWSPKSRFATDFRAARQGSRSWLSVLQEPGLRLGRTDPQLDPKGYRTVWMFQLADRQRDCSTGCAGQRVLSASQLFPEQEMVARLQAGELDAGVFYRLETIASGIPYLRLPAAVNQGDPALAAEYAAAQFTPDKGVTVRGSPILFTVTVPDTARDLRDALALTAYLLGPAGASALDGSGLIPAPHALGGDPAAVPAALRGLVLPR